MEKKNDILHTLRARKDEFHLPLREGSWEKLAEELASQPVVIRRRTPWRWWTIAAAVLLGILVSIPIFIQKEAVKIVSDSRTVPALSSAAADTLAASPLIPPHFITSIRTIEVPEAPSVSVVSESPVIAAIVENKVVTEKKEEVTPPDRKPMGPEPESRPSLPSEVLAGKRKSSRKHVDDWSVGVQAGSGKTTSGFGFGNSLPMNNMEESPSQPGKPNPDPDPEDPNPDKPEVETKAMPQSALRSSPPLHYRHRLPLTVGLSVRKSFTDEFALESGLSYTFLYSEISQQGLSVNSGSQQIHYLGIPLKANWTFYRQGPFSFYLAGGMLVEYAISARRNIQHESQSLDMNRWQFSLNGAVGAEVKLIRPVSLYLEPGIGYYFDNRSDVPTIRTERPWLFGVQVGLRFSY